MGRRRPYQPPAHAPLSVEERAALGDLAARAFASALAPKSEQNVQDTGRLYAQFCAEARLAQAFPPTLQSACFYMTDYVNRGNSPNSLTQVKSRLQTYCLEQGYDWFTPRQSFYLDRVCKGLRRLFKEPVRRAAPCTMAILLKLAAAADPADPLDCMVLSMCFVAHNGLLRLCELLALRVGDIRWDAVDRSSCSLRLIQAKTNQFGPPEWIPFEDFGAESGAGFLRDYVGRFGLAQRPPTAPLFPTNPAAAECTRGISAAAFTARFRRLLDRAGLPAAGYTGHSFRSGGATDLFNGRCRPHTIRLQGRWLSDAIWIYVRDCPEHRRQEVAAALRRVRHMLQ